MRFLIVYFTLSIYFSRNRIILSQIAPQPTSQPDALHLNFVKKCCQSLNDSENLHRCANESSYFQMESVLNNILNGAGPSLGVGIVSYATNDIFDYAAYSLSVNQAYSEHNGYVMLLLDPSTANYEPNDARWNKVKILEEAINPVTGWARDLDYIAWIDADLIFLDMNLRLEKVAAANPHAHIFISAEHAGSSTLINSGCVLIKNSKWSRTFLSDWWSYADRKLHSDQEQFDLLYHADKMKRQLDRYISILPPDALNSDPPAMTKQKKHNQVLHLMGEHSVFRIKVFKSAFQEICSFINSNNNSNNNISNNSNSSDNLIHHPSVQLKQQLGITQEVLHKWTLTEYSIESQVLMKNFEPLAFKGQNGLSQCRKLSNSIHHYAHALEHRSASGDKSTAEKLRIKVFELLLINLQNKRVENDKNRIETGRMLEDWPEMMKNVAEAGQNLLHIGNSKTRRNVANTVMAILKELYKSCHHIQKKAVLTMIAHIHTEIGMISLDENYIDDAIRHFDTSVNISIELANISGDHLLVTPMSNLANALSMQGKFSKSIPLFEKIITISERHLGVEHESIAQILVNCGIALVQNSNFVTAEKKLKRALHIMTKNNIDRSNVVYTRAVEYLTKARDKEL